MVDFCHNQLKSLEELDAALSGGSLEWLFVKHNDIKHVPVTFSKNLCGKAMKKLDLDVNAITTLD